MQGAPRRRSENSQSSAAQTRWFSLVISSASWQLDRSRPETRRPAVHRHKHDALSLPAKTVGPVAKVAKRKPEVSKECRICKDHSVTTDTAGHTLAHDRLKLVYVFELNVALAGTLEDRCTQPMLEGPP